MGSLCARKNRIIVSNTANIKGDFNAINTTTNSVPPKQEIKRYRSSIFMLNNENIQGKYIFKAQLGSGYYGVVKLAYHRNDPDKVYAVKSIDKTKLSPKRLLSAMNEIKILSTVDHPNIIKYYETYEDELYMHIVMEYCSGGEVLEQIIEEKRLNEQESCSIIYKIASVLAHCHSKGIVHRDLKPENVLFDNKSNFKDIKVIDFGLGTLGKESLFLHSVVGSPYYVAPEVLEGTYTNECDVWSLGVMTYLFLSGYPPFHANSKKELYDKIKTEEPVFTRSVWKKISGEAIMLIKQMLVKDYTKRPSAQEVMNSPWFSSLEMKSGRDLDIQEEVLNNMKQFREPTKLGKELLKFSLRSMKSEKMISLNKTFISLDTGKTGILKVDDIKDAFKKTNLEVNEAEIDEIVGRCSLFGKEGIDYTSFLAASLSAKELYSKQNMKQSFQKLDDENKGYITLENLLMAYKREGKVKDKDLIESIFDESGFTKESKITFDDFYKLFHQIRQRTLAYDDEIDLM